MRYLAGVLLTLATLLPALPPAGYAQTPSAVPARRMITGAVNEAARSRLAGNTRPEARNTANDRGLVEDSMPLVHMQLQLHRPADREQALGTLIDQLHDPKSPNYHHWLTPAEFGEQFGPAQSDIDAVTNWLTQQGFTVNFVYPSGLSVDYSGTAGQVRTAFHTEIHHLVVNGVTHFANMSDPEIPSALAPAVVGVVALHDFKARPHQVPKTEHPNASLGNGNFSVTPSDLATIYNFNPLFNAGYSGQGQTIAVVEPTNEASESDWATFRQTFGLSGYTSASLTTIHPAPPFGTTNCTDPGVVNEDTGEAALDMEYASAGAPSAAIIVAACKNTGTIDAELVAVQNLTNSPNHPYIISDSYGFCETENGAADTAAFGAIFQQGVAEGISYFVAAGDQDASSCDGDGGGTPYTTIHGIGVDAQASTPYAVATGGTDFADTYFQTNQTYWSSTNSSSYGSALSYIPEIPWNDTCASELVANWFGYNKTYGVNGSCNNLGHYYLSNVGGSGGPSACASGQPAVTGIVGGTCQGWPKPSWQSGFLGNPADGVRDIPDVSLFAADYGWDHIYIYCNSAYATCGSDVSQWSTSGGTSFTAPIYAGIQALVNQYTGSPQGLPNYVYYQIAAAEYGASGNSGCNSSNGNAVNTSCIFYDVTLGDDIAPCTADSGVYYNCYRPAGTYGVLSTDNSSYQPAYKTTIGWDFPTGLGTVNVTNLVMNWVTAGSGSAGLTVSVTGNGTVTSAAKYAVSCPSACSATFTGGPNVTLTATPANGWFFGSWGGACSGSGSCIVTMSQAQMVTATFVQGLILTVSETGSGGGTVTSSPAGISCPSTCSGAFAPNSQVILDAIPVAGSSFGGWSGACSGDGSCVVTMAAAENVTAAFTTNSGGGGGGGGGGQSAVSLFVDPEAGSDTASCTQTAPCLTLNYALSQAATGSTIAIVKAGTFGPIYLNGAITISGPASGTVTIVNDGSAPGCINGSAGSCASGDPNDAAIEIAGGNADHINLSNLTADGGTGGIAAIRVDAAYAVSLDTVNLQASASNTSLTALLYDVSTVPGASGSPHQLFVHNCDAGGSTGGGVLISPSVPTAANLSGGQAHNVKFGIKLDATAVASGSSVNAVVDGMQLFGFTNNAIVVIANSSGLATVAVSRSTITQALGNAFYVDGANATALLYSDTMDFSSTGVLNTASGAAYTFGNSNIFTNTTNVSGNALLPTPAGVGGQTQ